MNDGRSLRMIPLLNQSTPFASCHGRIGFEGFTCKLVTGGLPNAIINDSAYSGNCFLMRAVNASGNDVIVANVIPFGDFVLSQSQESGTRKT